MGSGTITQPITDKGTYDVNLVMSDSVNGIVRTGLNYKTNSKHHVVINSATKWGDSTQYASSFSVLDSQQGYAVFYASASSTGLANALVDFNITVS